MKRAVLIGFFVVSLSASASPWASPFPMVGSQALEAVWAGLRQCGLKVVNAYTPGLPQPQVPADLAILSPQGQLLAYYLETYGGGVWGVFKAPNGGSVHSVAYARDAIQFQTPYQGVVAHGNRFKTIAGPAYHYYCWSQTVAPEGFQACVKARWVDVIVGQLCRFGILPTTP